MYSAKEKYPGVIPKTIHYCWFGSSPLPQSAQKCIESWKKYCPEYGIKEWNESDFDVSGCAYTKEAYEAKRWAFVSDYARFKILYENGGIYFDTDVELLRPIDDLVASGSFMGREDDGRSKCLVNPGLGLAAGPGLGLYKEILDFYENRHFIKSDGSIDNTTVVTYTTDVLKKYGLKNINEVQQIQGIYIYPKEFFCPKSFDTRDLQITENTYSIHHYDGSWLTEEEELSINLQGKLKKLHLGIAGGYLAKFSAAVKYRGFFSAIRDLLDWLRRKNRRKDFGRRRFFG